MTAVPVALVWWTAGGPAIRQDTAVTAAFHAQDSIAGRLIDSVVVRSPLPDPFVPIVQWIFQRPSWVMIAGIVAAGLLGIALLLRLWHRRRRLFRWLSTRDRGVKLGLGASVAGLLLLIGAAGWKANDYVMHDNDFCRGCHIFVPSGQAFVRPDTGTYLLVNTLEGKHDTLQCHACHAFDIVAQSKELYYWIVERPDKIPPHAKVPRDVCERCHVRGSARHNWQRIAATAGHRVHLESDSLRRQGIGCLTCHARTAHRFQPADTTCAQRGCHLTDDIKIRLGRMAGQTGFHCNACHRFTADVPELATRDSAAGTLRPGSRQCFGCHEMRARLADFDPARDPHNGTCGMCHNPHTQVRPADALKSCTDANCHANWRAVDFHTGRAHHAAAPRCQTCHLPHRARVDASDCTGCHSAVEKRTRGRLHPPMPFDTLKALQQSSPKPEPEEDRPKGKGDAPPADDGPPTAAAPATVPVATQSDTFSHDRHRRLACLTCHEPNAPKTVLTFERPRGCQICHHQRPAGRACATCHSPDALAQPRPVAVTVTVPGHEARSREIGFEHPEHAGTRCVECHTTPVTLLPPPTIADCTGCHEQHHVARRNCASCHRTAQVLSAHSRRADRPMTDPHQACSDCHTPATVARLAVSRSFCLACHPSSVDHYAPKECTRCHFQTTPEQFRPRLTGREPVP